MINPTRRQLLIGSGAVALTAALGVPTALARPSGIDVRTLRRWATDT